MVRHENRATLAAPPFRSRHYASHPTSPQSLRSTRPLSITGLAPPLGLVSTPFLTPVGRCRRYPSPRTFSIMTPTGSSAPRNRLTYVLILLRAPFGFFRIGFHSTRISAATDVISGNVRKSSWKIRNSTRDNRTYCPSTTTPRASRSTSIDLGGIGWPQHGHTRTSLMCAKSLMCKTDHKKRFVVKGLLRRTEKVLRSDFFSLGGRKLQCECVNTSLRPHGCCSFR